MKPSEVKTNTIYRHFKGELYRVRCFAIHTETKETMVIYEEIPWGLIWARPIKMFCEMAERITDET